LFVGDDPFRGRDATTTERASQHAFLSSLARQRAGASLFGAALLLFFGFYYLSEPTGTDLFNRAGWVFYQTLRIGGIASGVIAWLMFAGIPAALFIDGLAAAAIGGVMIASSMLMLVDGGSVLQLLINGFCGYLFFSSGLRNIRDYRKGSRIDFSGMMGGGEDLKRREPTPLELDSQGDFTGGASGLTGEPSPPVAEPRNPDPAPAPSTSEGYLASLARRPPPKGS